MFQRIIYHHERERWSVSRLSKFVNILGLMMMLVLVTFHASLGQDTVAGVEAKATDELLNYVDAPDDAFDWKLVNDDRKIFGVSIHHLKLTSQRWQGITWTHDLFVIEPPTITHPEHMILFITGGSNLKQPVDEDLSAGMTLATQSGARVAVLHQVPNQPLLDGRSEDDLITETWLRYLDSGDASWPLLFPMVKSVVKTMDAVQAFAAEKQWQPIKGFVTTGASKRGWTSWLAPAADGRIIATAPMVIDMLNFSAQIKHQYAMWGAPSEQIHDYTSKGLIREDGTPRPGREANLWAMMDPYSYRDRVPVPKLLVVGANDPYWTTDAMNQYWDELPGEKSIFRAANAGHGLEGSRERGIATIAAFFQRVVTATPMPTLQWAFRPDVKAIAVEVTSDETPMKAMVWVARSPTMDFRKSVWQLESLAQENAGWAGSVAIVPGEHVAVFAELFFVQGSVPYSLSTLVHCQ